MAGNAQMCLEGWRLRMRYLIPRLDSTTSAIYREAFAAHVRKCSECAAWYSQMTQAASEAQLPEEADR